MSRCFVCGGKATRKCPKCHHHYCNNCYEMHGCYKMKRNAGLLIEENPEGDMDAYSSLKNLVETVVKAGLTSPDYDVEPVVELINMAQSTKVANEAKPLWFLAAWIADPKMYKYENDSR